MVPRSEDADRSTPRYVTIERRLAAAIEGGSLPPGAVLTEEGVARLFGTSRTPVRTALGGLLEQGRLARFDGRGFVVCDNGKAIAPRRLTLTREMLGLSADRPTTPLPVASDRIQRSFEAALSGALPFGLFRVNEQAAAHHYGVSRTVVRELMPRFQDRGMLRKDLRSHWTVGPLTAQDVAHHFAVRGKLESLALLDSAPRTPSEEIAAMRRRVAAALDQGAEASADAIAALERDIHVSLLSRSPNKHLLRIIRQSQVTLVVGNVFAKVVGVRPFRLDVQEYAIVLDFVMRGAFDAAANALEEHLRLSAERTRQRLISISVFPQPELPDFLTPTRH